jgi:enoyl-CoA hydratase
MCLTGRTIDATEAERRGLVSRVVRLASLFAEAIRIASVIVSMSLATTRMIKETVNRAFETPLAEGIQV